MTISTSVTTKNLQRGIEAARAGHKKEARKYFKVVLNHTPENIPALFWLAYVAPSPQISIRLLERVLNLDPENERARAGILWAEKRIAAEHAEVEQSDEITRQQLISKDEMLERAQKGAVAHRARRTINPFLAVLLLVGAVAMVVAGVWVMAFVPSDTLAAWLPGTNNTAATDIDSALAEVVEISPEVGTDGTARRALQLKPESAALNFASQADTLPNHTVAAVDIPAITKPANTAPAPLFAPDIPQFGPAPLESKLLPVDNRPETPVSFELQGPVGEAVTGLKLFEPVDKELLAHPPASPDEKWIEVNVTAQQVVAWEGNVPVMAFLTSTGLPNTPTVLGEYNIYWKLESTLMAGPGYYLPDVPYTMYFYAGYGLHGAYWHNNFGQPMSHGCVNLSNENSKQLFEWVAPIIPAGQTQVTATADNPGTLVVVHQ